MAKPRTRYVCENCGATQPRWMGRCPECGEWNTLLEQVVEEFVRYNPAFAYMRRTATRDTELGGRQVKAGDKLALWYVSGNRDETVFDDPHRFDVRRDPNPHQGFGGGGRHFCLGAGLARLELKLWLEETLRRFPDLALDGESDRLASTFLNQYRTIPVALKG